MMDNKLKLSRRGFLKLLGAGSATAVGGYMLSEFSPWLDYEEQVKKTWTSQNPSLPLRKLVHYATLAANGHNTQPWKFAIKDNAIEIHPDYSRRLPVVDPHDRELWISLGCSLENLLVAAHASGYTTQVSYPDTADFIHVQLTADTPQGSPLFDAIPLRQNTRSAYDGRLIKNQDLDQLQALQLEPGVGLQFATNPTSMETILEYVNLGNLAQYADNAFVDELIEWLRFNKKEALSSLDGLYSICSGNPQVPRLVGQMFVAGTKPQQQADADAAKFRTSPVAVVVASESDDKVSWVRTGQVYERLALKMTSLNIKSAFLNQPIEVSTLRGQFQSAIGLGSSLPQLLVRCGYAEAMHKSLRRPIDAVLI
jgi:hypothetical protein